MASERGISCQRSHEQILAIGLQVWRTKRAPVTPGYNDILAALVVVALRGIVSTTQRFDNETKDAYGDRAMVLIPNDIWEQFAASFKNIPALVIGASPSVT